MNGMGSNTIIKSVVVLMHPAASRCFRSSRQFCGVTDSVQYAFGGLGMFVSIHIVASHMLRVPCLPALKHSDEKEYNAVNSNNSGDNYYGVSVPTPVNRHHPPHKRQHAQLCQACGKVKQKLRDQAAVYISTLSTGGLHCICATLPCLQARGQILEGDIPNMSAPMKIHLSNIADDSKG